MSNMADVEAIVQMVSEEEKKMILRDNDIWRKRMMRSKHAGTAETSTLGRAERGLQFTIGRTHVAENNCQR